MGFKRFGVPRNGAHWNVLASALKSFASTIVPDFGPGPVPDPDPGVGRSNN